MFVLAVVITAVLTLLMVTRRPSRTGTFRIIIDYLQLSVLVSSPVSESPFLAIEPVQGSIHESGLFGCALATGPALGASLGYFLPLVMGVHLAIAHGVVEVLIRRRLAAAEAVGGGAAGAGTAQTNPLSVATSPATVGSDDTPENGSRGAAGGGGDADGRLKTHALHTPAASDGQGDAPARAKAAQSRRRKAVRAARRHRYQWREKMRLARWRLAFVVYNSVSFTSIKLLSCRTVGVPALGDSYSYSVLSTEPALFCGEAAHAAVAVVAALLLLGYTLGVPLLILWQSHRARVKRDAITRQLAAESRKFRADLALTDHRMMLAAMKVEKRYAGSLEQLHARADKLAQKFVRMVGVVALVKDFRVYRIALRQWFPAAFFARRAFAVLFAVLLSNDLLWRQAVLVLVALLLLLLQLRLHPFKTVRDNLMASAAMAALTLTAALELYIVSVSVGPNGVVDEEAIAGDTHAGRRAFVSAVNFVCLLIPLLYLLWYQVGRHIAAAVSKQRSKGQRGRPGGARGPQATTAARGRGGVSVAEGGGGGGHSRGASADAASRRSGGGAIDSTSTDPRDRSGAPAADTAGAASRLARLGATATTSATSGGGAAPTLKGKSKSKQRVPTGMRGVTDNPVYSGASRRVSSTTGARRSRAGGGAAASAAGGTTSVVTLTTVSLVCCVAVALTSVTGAHAASPGTTARVGVFSTASRSTGALTDKAASLAIGHVNDAAWLLPGLNLTAVVTNTGATGVDAATALLDLAADVAAPQLVAVVGQDFSSLSIALGLISAALQVPQMSYSSTAPVLSDEATFPTFTRTASSDALSAGALVRVLTAMRLRNVALVASDTDYSRGLADEFVVAAAAGPADQRVQVLARAEYKAIPRAGTGYGQGDMDASLASIDAAIDLVVASGTRVIVVHGTEVDTTPLLVRMWQRDVIPGSSRDPVMIVGTDGWLNGETTMNRFEDLDCDSGCAVSVRAAVHGAVGTVVSTRFAPASDAWYASVWDPAVQSQFLTGEEASRAGSTDWTFGGLPYLRSPFAYDCVWSLALAMHDVCFGGVTAAVAAAAAGGGGDDAAAAVIDVSGGGTGGGVSPIAAPGEACGVDGTCMAAAHTGDACLAALAAPGAAAAVVAAQRRIAFTGASGPVVLDDNGDRVMPLDILNVRDDGTFDKVGVVVPSVAAAPEVVLGPLTEAQRLALPPHLQVGCASLPDMCKAMHWAGTARDTEETGTAETANAGTSVAAFASRRPFEYLPTLPCGEGQVNVTQFGQMFCRRCEAGTFHRRSADSPDRNGAADRCSACPTNAVCPGGTHVGAARGHWQLTLGLDADGNLVQGDAMAGVRVLSFVRCYKPGDCCPAGTAARGCEAPRNSSASATAAAAAAVGDGGDMPVCGANRRGVLCGSCVEGTSKWGGECQACDDAGGWLVLYLLLLCGVMALMLLRWPASDGTVTACVEFAQLCAVVALPGGASPLLVLEPAMLAAHTGGVWPCAVSAGPAAAALLGFLFPVILAAMVALSWAAIVLAVRRRHAALLEWEAAQVAGLQAGGGAVGSKGNARRPKLPRRAALERAERRGLFKKFEEKWRSRLSLAWWRLLYLSYNTVTLTAFRAFTCRTVGGGDGGDGGGGGDGADGGDGGGGAAYFLLASDASLVCGSGGHTGVAFVGAVAFTSVTLGIPAYIAYYARKRRMHEALLSQQRALHEQYSGGGGAQRPVALGGKAGLHARGSGAGTNAAAAGAAATPVVAVPGGASSTTTGTSTSNGSTSSGGGGSGVGGNAGGSGAASGTGGSAHSMADARHMLEHASTETGGGPAASAATGDVEAKGADADTSGLVLTSAVDAFTPDDVRWHAMARRAIQEHRDLYEGMVVVLTSAREHRVYRRDLRDWFPAFDYCRRAVLLLLAALLDYDRQWRQVAIAVAVVMLLLSQLYLHPYAKATDNLLSSVLNGMLLIVAALELHSAAEGAEGGASDDNGGGAGGGDVAGSYVSVVESVCVGVLVLVLLVSQAVQPLAQWWRRKQAAAGRRHHLELMSRSIGVTEGDASRARGKSHAAGTAGSGRSVSNGGGVGKGKHERSGSARHARAAAEKAADRADRNDMRATHSQMPDSQA